MSADGALERRLARLEDERAIERLKYRYTQACDAGYDAEGITSLFVADGRWVCRPLSHGGEAVGHEQMRSFFQALAASISWAQHFASAPSIHIDQSGVRARASFYLLCLLTAGAGERAEAGAHAEATVLTGTYRDTFVKLGDRWFFEELDATLTQAAPWTEGWVRSPWGERAAP